MAKISMVIEREYDRITDCKHISRRRVCMALADLTARDELVYTSKCSEYNTYAIPQPKGAQPFSSSEFAALCKKSWNSMPWNEKGMLPVVTIKGKNEPMRVEWIRFVEVSRSQGCRQSVDISLAYFKTLHKITCIHCDPVRVWYQHLAVGLSAKHRLYWSKNKIKKIYYYFYLDESCYLSMRYYFQIICVFLCYYFIINLVLMIIAACSIIYSLVEQRSKCIASIAY
eukprot:895580_1